jgi:CheY-like chemotaxis protein
LELFVDVNPATPEAVALDAKRVSQVLHQLLANAVRFTRQGGVRLQVDAAPGRDGQGVWIAFSVSDTGPGVDAERLAEVLAPGDRVARAATRGYGLGTAISACVAEALGGRLTARSAAGQGTAFSLVIPTRALAPGEQPENEGLAQKRSQKPLSILVVDDHAATRRLASVFLAETAAKVTTASNGRHALEVWAKEPFDVVLTDLMMPDMDGFALASALRAQGEAGARVPIVAFSAEGALWDTARAQAAGLDGFVSKPLTPSSLFKEIERAVALRHVA